MRQTILFVVGLAAIVVQTVAASPILFSMKDTTVQRGTTFLYAVNVDSDLTGSDVYSYEVAVSYDPASFRLDSVLTGGTLSASWGAPAFTRGTNTISVAHAGITPLTGSGILFYLRLTAIPAYWSGGGWFQFTSVNLNEGAPTTQTRNGYISISNPPAITVTPDVQTLAAGNTAQYYVSGGTAPYTWSTTDPSVATIDQSGLLTGLHHGVCRVVARDNAGVVDTSGITRVLAFTISIHDTSFLQGQTVLVPVYVSDLTAANVVAGQFTMVFDQNMITALGTDQSGTLLDGAGQVQSNVGPGSMSVIFAGYSGVTGDGVLLYLRFRATLLYTGGTWMQFRNLVFNEDLEGSIDDGYVSITSRSILSISPSTGILVAGDSVQLEVTGSPRLPVQWSVSDSSVATVSASGVLKANRSGLVQASVIDSIGATGTSGTFTLYDIRLQGGSDEGGAGDTVLVPFHAGSYLPGVFSFQIALSYDPAAFEPVTVAGPGAGWYTELNPGTPGSVTIAAMSASPVSDSGTLAGIRFLIRPGTPLGTYSITVQSALLNEGRPMALTTNGSIRVGPTGVDDRGGDIPEKFVLHQNFPNPFNPTTSIRYGLPATGQVDVVVYDPSGRLICTLFSGVQSAGLHELTFDARGLSSGVYYYAVRTGRGAYARGMLLAR
jgi:hypothetical protein